MDSDILRWLIIFVEWGGESLWSGLFWIETLSFPISARCYLSKAVDQELFGYIRKLTGTYSGIEDHVFLGQQGLSAYGNLFLMVTNKSRIALHLSGNDILDRLNEPQESCLWKTGGRVLTNWILIPREFHDDEENLMDWLKLGYDYACDRSRAGSYEHLGY